MSLSPADKVHIKADFGQILGQLPSEQSASARASEDNRRSEQTLFAGKAEHILLPAGVSRVQQVWNQGAFGQLPAWRSQARRRANSPRVWRLLSHGCRRDD